MRARDFFATLLRDRAALRRYLAEIDTPPCVPRAPFYCPIPDPDKGERDTCTHRRRVRPHRHPLATWLRLLRRAYPGRYHHRTNPDAMLGPRAAPVSEGFPWHVLAGLARPAAAGAAELAWRLELLLSEVEAKEAAGGELDAREARLKDAAAALQAWRVEVYAAREAAGTRLFRDGDWWRAGAAEGRWRRFLGLFGGKRKPATPAEGAKP